MPEWGKKKQKKKTYFKFYFKLIFKLKTQIWIKTLTLKVNLGNKRISNIYILRKSTDIDIINCYKPKRSTIANRSFIQRKMELFMMINLKITPSQKFTLEILYPKTIATAIIIMLIK